MTLSGIVDTINDMSATQKVTQPQEKICKTCKRSFSNRKRWSSRAIWQEVQYCSARCRAMKNNTAFLAKYNR